MGTPAEALDIVVNFTIDGTNAYGVAAEAVHRLRQLRHRLQRPREEHALHELSADGEERGRDDPDADQSGVAGEARGGRLADSRQACATAWTATDFHAGCGRDRPLRGLAELHRDSAALGNARALASRPRWAPSSTATATSSGWRTTATTKPTCWAIACRAARAGRLAGAGSEHRRHRALHERAAGIAAHRLRGLLLPERFRRCASRPSSARSAARTPSTGNEDAQRERLMRDLNPTGRFARSERRDESHHALPGDGPGQRARHDPLRSAVDRARRPHPHLLGPGRAAADLHAHERRAAPPRARAAQQLHLQPDLELLQSAAPDHGASAGRLPDGRRPPAGRRRHLRPRFRGRRQRASGTVRDRWVGHPERSRRQSVPDDLRADRAFRRAQDSATGAAMRIPSPAGHGQHGGHRRAGRDRLQRGAARSALPPLPDAAHRSAGQPGRHAGRSTRRSRPSTTTATGKASSRRATC